MFDQVTPQSNNQPGQGMPQSQPPMGSVPPRPIPQAPNPIPQRPQPVNPYTQPAPKPSTPVQVGGVEDMFSGTDNPYTMPRSGQPMGNIPRYPMKNPNMYGSGFSFGKLLLPMLALVVLVLLGIAGWLSYSYLYSKNSSDLSGLNTNQAPINNEVVNPVNSNSAVPSDFPTETTQVSTSAPLVAPPGVPIPVINSSANPANNQIATSSSQMKDSDSDGLNDEEERRIGTDPLNPDTDSDGLIDFSEVDSVKGYHTNPLNPDTDGDGFKDGQEVINGFDPNKAGGARLPSTTPAKI